MTLHRPACVLACSLLALASCSSDSLGNEDKAAPAPLTIAATPDGNDAVEVEWSVSEPDVDFVIIVRFPGGVVSQNPEEGGRYEADDGFGTGRVMYAGDTSVSYLADIGLGCGAHTYAAWGRDTRGRWSDPASDGADVPGLPSGVVGSISVTSSAGVVDVQWTEPPNDPHFAYASLQRKATTPPSDPADGEHLCDCSGGSFTDTFDPGAGKFHYAAFACNSCGDCLPAAPSAAVDFDECVDPRPGPPPDVTDVVMTAGDGRAYIEWLPPNFYDWSGVRIIYREDASIAGWSDGTLLCEGWCVDSMGRPRFEHTGLVNGQSYTYKLFSYDVCQNYASGVSGTVVPMGDSTPPGEVQNASFTPGDSQNTINWVNPTDLDLAGVRLVVKATNDIADHNDGTEVCDPCTAPEDHLMLINGTTYYYGIFTYDSSGNYSSGVFGSATPVAPGITQLSWAGGISFGDALDADGDYLVVGAPTAAGNTGAVYVYQRTGPGNVWDGGFEITPSDPESSSEFGARVSISGDYLVVGAQDKTELVMGVPDGRVGAAYVYQRTGPNTWGNEFKVIAGDPEGSAKCGSGVGISGEFMIMGCRDKDEGLLTSGESGAAYIYRRGAGNTWGNEMKLVASDVEVTNSRARFGWAVDIHQVSGSEAYAAVGAIGAEGDPGNLITRSGSVYIYSLTGGPNTWGAEHRVRASDAAESDQFGRSIAIDGDYLVVGAWQKDVGMQSLAGAAYVYHRSSGNTWGSEFRLPDSVEEAYSQFGWRVDISGDYIVVGAPRETVDPSGADIGDAGQVHAYERTGTNIWGNEKVFVSPTPTGNGYLGQAVAVFGDWMMLGNTEMGGSTYVTNLSDLF